MIAKAEYLTVSVELQKIANSYENEMLHRLQTTTTQAASLNVAKQVADLYHKDVAKLLVSGYAQVGHTAMDHYSNVLNLGLTQHEKDVILTKLITEQLNEKYYGLTYQQRLTLSRVNNRQRLVKSSIVGKNLETRKRSMARIFQSPYPFGAQLPVDRRLLLSESVRLEHKIALNMAKRVDTVVVKWQLSDHHKQKDICDELASVVTEGAAKEIKGKRLPIYQGLYLLDEVPEIPHPNCQCSLRFITGDQITESRVQRAVDKVRDLFERLTGRKTNT